MRSLRDPFLALLLFLFYSALRMTWRIEIHEPPGFKKALADGTPLVFAHWHGDELGILYLLRRYKAAVMTSTSKDGELMNMIVKLFGAKSSRGSSTRGGASALKGIIRLAREGWRPTVAVDGPKGPIYKVKPGVFEISKITGGHIVPISVACSRKKVFEKAWNKTFLPLPFARLVVVWRDPLPPVARDGDSRSSELAERLEIELSAAGQQALHLLATT